MSEITSNQICDVCAASGDETPAAAVRLAYMPDIAGPQPARVHLCPACLAQREAISWDPDSYIPRGLPWRTGNSKAGAEEWGQDGEVMGRPVRAYWVIPADPIRAWMFMPPEEAVRHEWTD